MNGFKMKKAALSSVARRQKLFVYTNARYWSRATTQTVNVIAAFVSRLSSKVLLTNFVSAFAPTSPTNGT
ncbi:MAG: hypothetical protein A2W65_01925 [Candidatus Taylorbacteria bacterium RIFCSPLOWO2_02_50_13]|nr:MAG: hypothetical protein UY62_C0039G0020 [Parcubacteria group bacterium GW2011_GWF2_50_9]OHA36739.1 MAG: hypothetical protein A2W65_01925 [Candidatus Taylorbacteria bacterium RIFCSPLOWO2_02_50_13]